MEYAARSCIGKRCNTYMHIPIKISVTFSNCIVSETLNLISGVNEKTDTFLPPANEVWGKVIFSEACVKNSVHRGDLPQCMLGYHHPPGADIPRPGNPGADTPQQTPPGAEPPSSSPLPPGADPPRPGTPPSPPRSRQPHWCRACWEILSIRGRYASYWNTHLVLLTITSETYINRDQ